jgi:hypothetical protein
VKEVDERCEACTLLASARARRDEFGRCAGTASSDREAEGVSWCAALAERREEKEE